MSAERPDWRNSHKDKERLRDVLDSLAHLNMTGQTEIEGPARNAHAEHCYMFVGYMKGSGTSRNARRNKVAMKRLRTDIYDEHDFEKILANEVSIWSRLDHPNVLEFVGYALEENGCPLLISEWMENGTIKEYVKNNPSCDLHLLVIGIAEGLAFLHSKKVIHGDMKSANILVSNSGQPQICDFGISRIISASESPFGETSDYGLRGSLRWMAPEFFAIENNVTESSDKTDIWAFGMTIYELLTGTVPYSHVGVNPLVMFLLVKYELPPAPMDLSAPEQQFLWSVCEYCWLLSEVRPTITMICRALESNAEEVRKLLQSASTTLRLRRTLQDFQHFDLSGKITQEENYSRDHGASSDVYFGRSLVHNLDVAIKRVRYRLHDDVTFLKRMVRELQIWVKLTDKNILPLLGYTTDGGINYLSLITEWMSNRTVIHYMKSNKKNSARVLYIVKGIASGLAYLHSNDVIHSDLKSGNVLVSSEGEPLLTDFGISHMLSPSSNSVMPLTTGFYGTMRWMAYEQLHLEDWQMPVPYTFKTDVWSFGMTILELLTLKLPYAIIPSDIQVMFAIQNGQLPLQPEAYSSEWSEERKRLWAICESCWNLDPNARPSIDAIKHELDGI